MRFSDAETMCDPTHYVPLALSAECAGYTSFTIPDSVCYPETSDSKYPYTKDGNREFLDGKPFIDPFVLISTLAAVTETLRFTTFVVKLAIRQPVLVAKQAMSVATMSNNRFGFGVTDLIVGFRDACNGDDQPLDQKLGALEGFANNVIAKL